MADAHFTGYVYVVTNTINGKQYVGQTTMSVQRRWRAHVSAAFSDRCFNTAIGRAIRKYGAAAFHVEAMLERTSQADLDAAEMATVERLGSLVPAGYNVRRGGHGGGMLHPETRQKMSVARTGKPMALSARSKSSATRRGMRPSTETRLKLQAAHRGVPLSQAHKDGIGRSMKGRQFTADWRAKISAAKRAPSDETREKLRAAMLGRRPSEETLARMRLAQRARQARR